MVCFWDFVWGEGLKKTWILDPRRESFIVCFWDFWGGLKKTWFLDPRRASVMVCFWDFWGGLKKHGFPIEMMIFLNLSKNDVLSDESPCDFDHFWKMTRFSLFPSSFLISREISREKWLFRWKGVSFTLWLWNLRDFSTNKDAFQILTTM